MRADDFRFQADDGKPIFVYRWLPDEGTKTVGTVHVAHGMGEHAARYARFAEALTARGFAVYANDHRGHGKTGEDELGYAGKDGFRRIAADLIALIAHEKAEQKGLPFFAFGHSMGSFLTQEVLIQAGGSLAGAILSASSGKPNLLAQAGRVVARAERARLGARERSSLLTKLSFDAFNKAFAPNRTAFDWLSRDEHEVDKYVADPLCGFPVSTQLWVDLLDGTASIAKVERQARVPKELPILIIAGSEDPVSDRTKNLRPLVTAYQQAGIRDVTHTFYAGGRHELLNETNRDEVTSDIIGWLERATT
jgi:alpha-beta hydrolase superfamily lysophospholipase